MEVVNRLLKLCKKINSTKIIDGTNTMEPRNERAENRAPNLSRK